MTRLFRRLTQTLCFCILFFSFYHIQAEDQCKTQITRQIDEYKLSEFALTQEDVIKIIDYQKGFKDALDSVYFAAQMIMSEKFTLKQNSVVQMTKLVLSIVLSFAPIPYIELVKKGIEAGIDRLDVFLQKNWARKVLKLASSKEEFKEKSVRLAIKLTKNEFKRKQILSLCAKGTPNQSSPTKLGIEDARHLVKAWVNHKIPSATESELAEYLLRVNHDHNEATYV